MPPREGSRASTDRRAPPSPEVSSPRRGAQGGRRGFIDKRRTRGNGSGAVPSGLPYFGGCAWREIPRCGKPAGSILPFARISSIQTASVADLDSISGIAYDTIVKQRRVVLDTNVVIAALRSRQGLRTSCSLFWEEIGLKSRSPCPWCSNTRTPLPATWWKNYTIDRRSMTCSIFSAISPIGKAFSSCGGRICQIPRMTWSWSLLSRQDASPSSLTMCGTLWGRSVSA